jgi:hypothetical protein
MSLKAGCSSKFSGVVTDKTRLKSGQKPYRAQVSVPDCRENKYACPGCPSSSEAAGAKCDCRPLYRKRSTTFYTQEEAARAWNELVVKWGLDEMKVEPLVLNRLSRCLPDFWNSATGTVTGRY